MRKIFNFILLIMLTCFTASAQSDQQPTAATNPLSNILIWKNQNDTTTRELYTNLGYSGGVPRFERIPRYHDLQFKFLAKMDSVTNSGYVTHGYFNSVGGTLYVRNQNTLAQSLAKFWIDGEARAGNFYTEDPNDPNNRGILDFSAVAILGDRNKFDADSRNIEFFHTGSGASLFALNVDTLNGNNISGYRVIFNDTLRSTKTPTNPLDVVRLQDLPGGIIGGHDPTKLNTTDTSGLLATRYWATHNNSTYYGDRFFAGDNYFYTGSGNKTTISSNGIGIDATNGGAEFIISNASTGYYAQVLPNRVQVTDNTAQTAYKPDGIEYYVPSLGYKQYINYNPSITATRSILFPDASGTIALIGGAGGALPVSDTTAFARKTAVTFGSPAYTQNNIRFAVWGDSMTRGTGSPTAPYTNTFLYYLGLLSNYAIYNGGNNGETSAQIKVRALADTAKRHWKQIFWAGRNDVTTGVLTPVTLANIAQMVANTDNPNYIVMGVLYKQSEIIGTAARDTVTVLNNTLASKYAGHYFDPNPALIAAYNPSLPQDVTDHTNGVFPSSLGFGDGTHLNSAGQQVNANELFKYFKYLYTDRKYISSENIVAALDKPTPIGNSIPNSGSFTQFSSTDTVTNNTQNNTSLSNISRSGSFIASGQLFNYAASVNNSSTLASGGGSLYNVALLVNSSNGVANAGNVAIWSQTGSVIIGTSTSGFAGNKLDVQGISRFGVAGAINGDMTVANQITVNQGTGGISKITANATGTSGTAFLNISNTATSGIVWGFRLGGNTANGAAGGGVNEGNLALYDQTNNKLALHVQKLTTNIGLHGVFNATAQLQFAASSTTAKSAPIKFGTNSIVMTTPEALTLEATNSSLFFTDTIATVKTRREILLDTKTQNVTNKTFDILRLASGANSSKGTATLAAGTITVSNTAVTASSIIIPVRQAAGGTVGTLSYTITAGTGFTITSSSSTDTSTLAYLVIN